MSKENILRITLFVSVLAFNPVVAETLNTRQNIQTQQTTTNSVASSISTILHKRGLDEDAAQEIGESFVEDDDLFYSMMENILSGCRSINKDELITYLSNEALFRKNVSLDSYDQLVSMLSKIKQQAPNEVTLAELQLIAQKNKLLKV